MCKNCKIIEEKLKELEKRVVALEGQVQEQAKECSYLSCKHQAKILDDVEVAPGVIEKKYVCQQHMGQLTGNISIESKVNR